MLHRHCCRVKSVGPCRVCLNVGYRCRFGIPMCVCVLCFVDCIASFVLFVFAVDHQFVFDLVVVGL